MIKRIWHGWTTPDRAQAYEDLLRNIVFPGIEAKRIPGYRHVELMRADGPDETEFISVMTFDSIDSVIAFQGEEYARAYVPDAARKILSRWDERSMHYEVRIESAIG